MGAAVGRHVDVRDTVLGPAAISKRRLVRCRRERECVKRDNQSALVCAADVIKVKKGCKVVRPGDVRGRQTLKCGRRGSGERVRSTTLRHGTTTSVQADDCSEETWIMFVEAADQVLLCRSVCEVHCGTDLALSQEGVVKRSNIEGSARSQSLGLLTCAVEPV